MGASDLFGLGMGNLPLLSNAKSRSISAENPDGAVGGGAKADPEGEGAARELGVGWKVRPCITLAQGETVTLAEIDGPGVIRHIWITCKPEAFRSCILRMYWDGEETPSVEVPLGDFFCCGHEQRAKVVSMPINVNPAGGCNSYWPMPFRKSAKVTIQNEWHEDIRGFFYQFDYSLEPVPDDAACFHAQWRRALTTRECPKHVVLDGVKGKGHFVGTYMAWTAFSNGWWGEGEMKFFLDGDGENPTICTTGTEDYFGGAWCFYGPDGVEEPFSAPFLGLPLVDVGNGRVRRFGLYRWHVMDPVRFDEGLKATMQALGWWPDGKYEPLTDDIASTAYWYQAEPHAPFPALPEPNARWAR
jgi:D-arabinan exo alpha-(1,3)/(1,5)-arabinofuranosidase (non-reducing end)